MTLVTHSAAKCIWLRKNAEWSLLGSKSKYPGLTNFCFRERHLQPFTFDRISSSLDEFSFSRCDSHDQLFAWIHGYYVKLHYLPHNYPIIMFKILYWSKWEVWSTLTTFPMLICTKSSQLITGTMCSVFARWRWHLDNKMKHSPASQDTWPLKPRRWVSLLDRSKIFVPLSEVGYLSSDKASRLLTFTSSQPKSEKLKVSGDIYSVVYVSLVLVRICTPTERVFSFHGTIIIHR